MLQSTLQYLVKKLKVSNKEAIQLIVEKKLYVNGSLATLRQVISDYDEVVFDTRILQYAKKHIYIAYYKPRGIECTLNPAIYNNLHSVFHYPEKLFPIGRLDKESEGLLLLTNDGNTYNQLAHSEQHVEKEYEVTVTKPLTNEAIQQLRNGIEIMGKTTREAKVEKMNDYTFNIILTQGLNRQIRRMCYKIGYEVENLKRTRIATISIDHLQAGEWREIESFLFRI